MYGCCSCSPEDFVSEGTDMSHSRGGMQFSLHEWPNGTHSRGARTYTMFGAMHGRGHAERRSPPPYMSGSQRQGSAASRRRLSQSTGSASSRSGWFSWALHYTKGLYFEDPNIESDYLVYLYKSRRTASVAYVVIACVLVGSGIMIWVTTIRLGFVVWDVAGILMWVVCVVLLALLNRQHTLLTVSHQNSIGNGALRRNARRYEAVLLAATFASGWVTMGFNGAQENCDYVPASRRLVDCREAINSEGMIVLLMTSTVFFTPARFVYHMPLIFVCAAGFVAALFVAVSDIVTNYWRSQVIMVTINAVIAAATLCWRELRNRREFCVFLDREYRAHELFLVRAETTRMVASQAPLELFRSEKPFSAQLLAAEQRSGYGVSLIRHLGTSSSAVVCCCKVDGFARLCGTRSPLDIVEILRRTFTAMDDLRAWYNSRDLSPLEQRGIGVAKVHTIGDMCFFMHDEDDPQTRSASSATRSSRRSGKPFLSRSQSHDVKTSSNNLESDAGLLLFALACVEVVVAAVDNLVAQLVSSDDDGIVVRSDAADHAQSGARSLQVAADERVEWRRKDETLRSLLTPCIGLGFGFVSGSFSTLSKTFSLSGPSVDSAFAAADMCCANRHPASKGRRGCVGLSDSWSRRFGRQLPFLSHMLSETAVVDVRRSTHPSLFLQETPVPTTENITISVVAPPPEPMLELTSFSTLRGASTANLSACRADGLSSSAPSALHYSQDFPVSPRVLSSPHGHAPTVECTPSSLGGDGGGHLQLTSEAPDTQLADAQLDTQLDTHFCGVFLKFVDFRTEKAYEAHCAAYSSSEVAWSAVASILSFGVILGIIACYNNDLWERGADRPLFWTILGFLCNISVLCIALVWDVVPPAPIAQLSGTAHETPASVLHHRVYALGGATVRSVMYLIFAAASVAFYTTAILVTPSGSTLGDSQVFWLFMQTNWALISPSYVRPVAMWIYFDIPLSIAFLCRTIARFQMQSTSRNTMLYIEGGMIVYMAVVRLIIDHAKRTAFATEVESLQLKEQLEKDSQALEETLQAVAPVGIARDMALNCRQRSAVHRRDQPHHSLANNPLSGSADAGRDVSVEAAHPLRSTTWCSSVWDVPLLLVRIQSAVPPRPPGSVSSARQLNELRPQSDRRPLTVVHSVLQRLVLDWPHPPCMRLEVYKSSEVELRICVASVQASPTEAKKDQDEERCYELLRFIAVLFQRLSAAAFAGQHVPLVTAVATVGPVVGAVLGHDSVAFDYYGAAVIEAQEAATYLHDVACAASASDVRHWWLSERFVEHCIRYDRKVGEGGERSAADTLRWVTCVPSGVDKEALPLVLDVRADPQPLTCQFSSMRRVRLRRATLHPINTETVASPQK